MDDLNHHGITESVESDNHGSVVTIDDVESQIKKFKKSVSEYYMIICGGTFCIGGNQSRSGGIANEHCYGWI